MRDVLWTHGKRLRGTGPGGWVQVTGSGEAREVGQVRGGVRLGQRPVLLAGGRGRGRGRGTGDGPGGPARGTGPGGPARRTGQGGPGKGDQARGDRPGRPSQADQARQTEPGRPSQADQARQTRPGRPSQAGQADQARQTRPGRPGQADRARQTEPGRPSQGVGEQTWAAGGRGPRLPAWWSSAEGVGVALSEGGGGRCASWSSARVRGKGRGLPAQPSARTRDDAGS